MEIFSQSVNEQDEPRLIMISAAHTTMFRWLTGIMTPSQHYEALNVRIIATYEMERFKSTNICKGHWHL